MKIERSANMFAKIGTVMVRVERVGGVWCSDSDQCRVPSIMSDAVNAPAAEESKCTSPLSRPSDCDSDVATRSSRRKGKSFARRRYIYVFTTVCLLLLIEGLLPKTSAAPHNIFTSKKMERPKRATNAQGENPLWGNPCDYINVNQTPVLEYNPERARNVAQLAKNVRERAGAYADYFADQIHSFQSFELLLTEWESSEWLRKYSWFTQEVLPGSKMYKQPVPEEYINDLMGNIDDVLPNLYKGLKMVVAALNAMQNEGLNDQPSPKLKENVRQSMNDVRGVLCKFNELMQSRSLEIPLINEGDIPHFDNRTMEKEVLMLLIYRDTLNLLEYIVQVMDKLAVQK